MRNTLPNAAQFLSLDAKTVQWRPEAPFSLDVINFEEKLTESEAARQAGHHTQAAELWATATDLYKGDLLPNCADSWILPVRERLRQQFVTILAQLADWQEAQRDYPAAIRTTRRLLRHDPLHEAAHRRLMQLYLINEERAEALRVYHACVTLLQQELQVDPSPATWEIYDRILSVSTPSQPPAVNPGQHSGRLPLVGRKAEWQRLLKAWQVASKAPHCVIIAGEAGIGKSRLAEELRLWANRQGIITAYSRAFEAGRNLAYAPVANWLRGDPLQPSLAGLEPIWLTEITRLLPELLTQHPDLPRPHPLTESWQRHRLFDALCRAVAQATPPLLLVLDDLQWCDLETLAWLGHLLRFDPQASLLLVGTVRIEEIDNDHPLTPLWRDLRRTGLLAEIELGPLDAAETTALAERIIERPLESSAAARLYQETEGNPLFVVETVRAGPLAAIDAGVTSAYLKLIT